MSSEKVLFKFASPSTACLKQYPLPKFQRYETQTRTKSESDLQKGDTSKEAARRSEALKDWLPQMHPEKPPKPPAQGKSKSKKRVLIELSGSGDGVPQPRSRLTTPEGAEQAELVRYDPAEQLRSFAREVFTQEGTEIMTEKIEEVIDRVQRHVCEINLDQDRFLTVDTKLAMHEQERKIAVETGCPDRAFRTIRGKKDMWGLPLVAGCTYNLEEGNGTRRAIKFEWNGTETELGIFNTIAKVLRRLVIGKQNSKSCVSAWSFGSS
jgi:hypothetical protein